MELLGFLALALFALVVATPIVALVALRRTSAQSEEIRLLRAEIVALRRWIRRVADEDDSVPGVSSDPSVAPHQARTTTPGLATTARLSPDPVAASRFDRATPVAELPDDASDSATESFPEGRTAAAEANAGDAGTTAGDAGTTAGGAGAAAWAAATAAEGAAAAAGGPDAADGGTAPDVPGSDADLGSPEVEGTTAGAAEREAGGGQAGAGPTDGPGAHRDARTAAGAGAPDAPGSGQPGTDWAFWDQTGKRQKGASEGTDQRSEQAAARTAIDFETLIGSTWLLRIGLGILAIALALFARSILPQLPAVAKVALAYAGAIGLFATGKVFEENLEKFARPVMAAGLTFGFFVAFAAHFVPAMSAVTLPVSIVWMVVSMGTVLVAAERWQSQTTAALAIILGHISAYVAVGDAAIYSLVMIAFLSLTAMLLMLRNTWMVVGLFAIAASYGAHLLWLLADGNTLAGEIGFWLNLAFLTSYYVIFLIGDVLWWRRDREREDGDLPEAQIRAARQTGPTNLVLYASLTSFVYLLTDAQVESIEWFYLTLGAIQGGLAWYYWRIEHRDFVFYPAFGTVLWTLGWFAALDALALNLVLAAQALLLLIAAHHTRLLVFHLLAQLALVVAFIHYLAYPTPIGSSLGLFIGGLGIAGVYLLKASLEEIWYGEDGVELDRDVDRKEPPFVERKLTEIFRLVAPFLAPTHAALGGFVLVRELTQHLGVGRQAGMALVGAHVLLAALVLFRKRGALLFSFTVLALSGPYFAYESGDALATLALLGGLMAVALVLVHLLDRPAYGAIAKHGSMHGQVVAGLVLLGLAAALDAFELGFSAYLPAMIIPFLIFVFQERVSSGGYAEEGSDGSLPSSTPARVSWAMCVGVALLVHGLTVESVGVVAVAPVWVAAWSVAIALAAVGRRSGQLFLAGYALLCWGYMDLANRSGAVWADAMETIWIGTVVTLVPLLYALGMDRATHDRARDDEPVPSVAGPMTYVMYALGLFLVAAFAGFQVAPGWSVLTPALFGIVLMLVGPRLRAERAAPSVVVAFVGLHLLVGTAGLEGSGIEELLIPLLLFCVATLACERLLDEAPPHEELKQAWRYVPMVLVVLATWTAMLAIYESEQLGRQWATAGWSVLGVSLMGAGFGFRSSNHRRVALAVLGICLIRVFVVDTQGLSDTARTGVFFVLGLCLVGVAWLYTRFSEELKSWL